MSIMLVKQAGFAHYLDTPMICSLVFKINLQRLVQITTFYQSQHWQSLYRILLLLIQYLSIYQCRSNLPMSHQLTDG